MIRIHLQSLKKLASNRLANNAPSGGQPHRQAHKGPMKRHGDEPQDHGGEPLLHRTYERIRRRDRDPDGDEQSQQEALQTGKKQKVQPVGLANQRRDVLIECLDSMDEGQQCRVNLSRRAVVQRSHAQRIAIAISRVGGGGGGAAAAIAIAIARAAAGGGIAIAIARAAAAAAAGTGAGIATTVTAGDGGGEGSEISSVGGEGSESQ